MPEQPTDFEGIPIDKTLYAEFTVKPGSEARVSANDA